MTDFFLFDNCQINKITKDTMGNDASKMSGNNRNKNESFYSARGAYHSGSWYSNRAKDLSTTLEQFLSEATLPSETLQALTATTLASSSSSSEQEQKRPYEERPMLLRGVVCPHAGYSYSGPTAAYSYKALQHEMQLVASGSSPIRTIVVLHPSHHIFLPGCSVSGASQLETPVGNLLVDQELRSEILQIQQQKTNFSIMKQEEDEREHSGEMQYPYVAHILKQCNLLQQVKVLPIMCGALTVPQEVQFGTVLGEILDRPHVLSVVSTDFCHWGSRFQFHPRPPLNPSTGKDEIPIHEYISRLDHRGMDLIASQSPDDFAQYLRETNNTICGRHAIAVWLRAMESISKQQEQQRQQSGSSFQIEFVKYAQSSAVVSPRDSSVSYAAALATRRQAV